MEENTVSICVRVLRRKTKPRTIRIAFETPVMIKHSQCEEWSDYSIACVAGGISRVRAFVLVAKP